MRAARCSCGCERCAEALGASRSGGTSCLSVSVSVSLSVSLWSLCGVFVGTWTACLFASSAWRMEDLEDLEESCGADARSRSGSIVAGVCCQVSAGRGGRQAGRCGWLYGWSPEVCVGRWMGGGARAGRRLVAGGCVKRACISGRLRQARAGRGGPRRGEERTWAPRAFRRSGV